MHHNYNERQHTISKSKAEEAKEQLEICGQRHFTFVSHLNTDYLQLFSKEQLIVGELRFPSSGLVSKTAQLLTVVTPLHDMQARLH